MQDCWYIIDLNVPITHDFCISEANSKNLSPIALLPPTREKWQPKEPTYKCRFGILQRGVHHPKSKQKRNAWRSTVPHGLCCACRGVLVGNQELDGRGLIVGSITIMLPPWEEVDLHTFPIKYCPAEVWQWPKAWLFLQ
jgi:hypothetical protein